MWSVITVESLTSCRSNYKNSTFFSVKTLSVDPVGVELTTFCTIVRLSTNWATLVGGSVVVLKKVFCFMFYYQRLQDLSVNLTCVIILIRFEHSGKKFKMSCNACHSMIAQFDKNRKMSCKPPGLSSSKAGLCYPEAFFNPSDLVNTKTTMPLRVGEERWIYTSTLRISVYIHLYSPPLRGIVV